jgi:hypothetical protein
MEGWLYLAVVLDLFSRQVVGWLSKNDRQIDRFRTISAGNCFIINFMSTRYYRYVNLNIDLGITPAKSMKLMAKCASMIAGRELVLRYAIIKTAPIADAIITACIPRLQCIKPNAIEEIMTITNVFFVYLLINERKNPRKTSSSHIPTINSLHLSSVNQPESKH